MRFLCRLIVFALCSVCAGGEVGEKSPWQPHQYRLNGFAMPHTWVQSPDAIADLGVNIQYLQGAYSDLFFQWTSMDTAQLVEPMEETRRKIAAFHDKGIKVMAGISLVPRYFPTNMEIAADMLPHFVRDRNGEVYPDEIEVDRYDAFLLPSGKCISDAALEFLAKRASEGKMVMASEGLGERTEEFSPRVESLPRPLDKVKGFDLDLPSELEPFNESKLSAEARNLVEVIREGTEEQIAVDHPQVDRLASKLVRTDKGMLLHILNLNIPTFPTLPEREQLVQEAAVPAKDVKITLKLERGEKVKDVRGLSPDHEAVAIPLEQEGDMLSFIVPEVGVWEMVEVAW